MSASPAASRSPVPLAGRWWVRALVALGYVAALWWILNKGWDRRAVWRTELVDKGIGGDGIQYWQMAVGMERDHMISIDGKSPTWMRLPGYPALLRYTTRPAESDEGSKEPDAIKRRIDAWLKRAVRVNLVVDLGSGVAAALLAFALGGGPLALVAAAVWAWQPWSSVVAIHTLSDPLAALLTTLCLAALVMAARSGPRSSLAWLVLGALLAAAAQYVRPDSIVALPALAIAGWLSARGGWRAHLLRVFIALGVWAAAFAWWPCRNLGLFGELHPLGSSGVDGKGRLVDRGASNEWMRTWATGQENETLHVAWKLPSQGVRWVDVPHTAYANSEELNTMRHFLLDYERAGARLDDELMRRLRAMAAVRRARDPWSFYVRLPLERIKLRLLPPRDGYGLGSLPFIREDRERLERLDTRMVIGGLVGLALLCLRPSRRAAATVAGLYLLARLVLIGWIPAPEPRYMLEALPLLLAAAVTLPDSLTAALYALWQRRARKKAGQRPRPVAHSDGASAP